MIWAMTVSRLSVALFHFADKQKSCRSCELTALGRLRVQSYYIFKKYTIHKNEYLSNVSHNLYTIIKKVMNISPKGLKEKSLFCQNSLCTYLCIQDIFFSISYYQGIILYGNITVRNDEYQGDLSTTASAIPLHRVVLMCSPKSYL